MPAIRNWASGAAAISGAPSVSLSASAVTGDVAVLIHSSERGSATSIQAPSATSGGGPWTEQVNIQQGSYNNVGKMWTAPVTSTGTFSVTTTASANNPIYAFLLIMSDAVFDEAVGFAVSSTPSMPSVDADEAGSFLIGHICYGDPRPGATAPTGMTSLGYVVDSGNIGAAQTFYQNNVGPGATGTKTVTGISNTSGVSMSVVFKPAPPPAPVNTPGAFFPFFGAP